MSTKAWRLGGAALGLGLAGILGLVALGIYIGTSWKKPALPRRVADFPSPPKLDGLIASAEAQLRDNQQNLEARVRLGILYFEKGKNSYTEAINELEEARNLGAMDPRIFYCLGVMYQELGLYSFAAEEYQRFLRNRPQDKEVRLLLAKIFYHEARYGAAVDEYERLKFNFPHDALIEENLALSLFKAKNYAQAAESFQKLKTSGGHAAKRAVFHNAQMDYEQGAAQRALAAIKAEGPWEADPGSGIAPQEAYSLAASAAETLKLYDEARGFLEKVLSFSANNLKAKSALKQFNRRFPPKKKKARLKP